MSENIRPSEVSEILLQQLKEIDTSLQFEEVGTVLQVSDGVVRIYGLLNAEANELLEFENGIKAIVMNLEEDNVGAVLLGPTDQIKEGMVVKRTKRIASIQAGNDARYAQTPRKSSCRTDRRQLRDRGSRHF